MATHKDWLKTREDRDTEARRAVRRLLEGSVDEAMEHAKKWDEYDDAMSRIAKELDGRGSK